MSVQKELKNLGILYEKEVEKIALHCFSDVIKPWLIKHHYRFSSGMGTWAVWDKRDRYISRDRLPNKIVEILEAHTLSENDLGEFMPDFDPEN